ncbi:DUF5615 family PIN-like protein [Nocardia sp. GCM10030253]|uniref:DUF5615 family PIN-like protein n=1 Tax=Nocardia sp. GCM10030253 TaxID=3273404 RepID=UPI003641A5B6
MKFLIDAQLPAKLAAFLKTTGHDVVHTSELQRGNRTTDTIIATLADREGRIVVTKDRDFWIGHLLDGSPRSLLLVSTGNIANAALLQLFIDHLDDVVTLLSQSAVIELGRDRLVAHTDRDPSGEN